MSLGGQCGLLTLGSGARKKEAGSVVIDRGKHPVGEMLGSILLLKSGLRSGTIAAFNFSLFNLSSKLSRY